jgi:hypothetical protein
MGAGLIVVLQGGGRTKDARKRPIICQIFQAYQLTLLSPYSFHGILCGIRRPGEAL